MNRALAAFLLLMSGPLSAAAQTRARLALPAPGASVSLAPVPVPTLGQSPLSAAMTPSIAPSAASLPERRAPQSALRALSESSLPAAAAEVFDQGRPAAATDDILLIQAVAEEDGRRGTGRDQSQKLEELVARSEGAVRSLDRDGPFSLFQRTFALEVRPSERARVLAELRAIAGIEHYSLTELLSLAARREPQTPPDAAELAAYKDRLARGSLAGRLGAFAELASALEAATPEKIAVIPAQTRDELLVPLHNLAGTAINTFNLIQGAARQDARERLHGAGTERKDGWAGLEKAAQEALKDPAISARFMPLRATVARAIETIDRLDTPAARAMVLEMLPHAQNAGLEFVAADPGRRAAYVREWLGIVAGSADETAEGMRQGGRSEAWTGSVRGGGYTHVEGSRRSTYLYQWKSGRFDPAEMKHELLLTFGMPGGETLAAALLAVLETFQTRMPELEALNYRQHMDRELRRIEGNLEHHRSQAEENGRFVSAEDMRRLRARMREEAEASYKRHDRMDGHSVIDGLLMSLHYDPREAAVPGFDRSRFIANALLFFSDALRRLDEPGLVRQLTDAAVSFLTEIVDEPVLSPPLRAQAVAVWRAVASKARAMGIGLNTTLDGVVDPRPQTLIADPELLGGSGSDTTVWQLATSPDGRYIARAAGDRGVKIWDARTRALIKTIQLDDARQLYGDLANSLGVSWTAGGRLLVSTLHDGEEEGRRFSYNLVRSFDLNAPGEAFGPGDAVSSVRIPDVYVLREIGEGPQGPFYATMRELRNEQRHYLGAEVGLVGADGRKHAVIGDSVLLGLSATSLLVAAPGKSAPRLSLWDVSDPSRPVDATPEWLKSFVAAWRGRNPRNEYGWWPPISAKLASFQGRPALVIHDEGRLQTFDARTGAVLSSLEVPNGWDAAPFVTDESGRYLAAVVKAPGRFNGPNPERLMIWSLATGEIVMERDVTYVPQSWLFRRGQSVSHLLFSRDGKRLIAADRSKVQVFDLP